MRFVDVWGRFGAKLRAALRAAGREPSQRQQRRARPANGVETLQSRSLPTGLALIAGAVFDDLTGDGLSGDDPALTAIAVSLFRDGGNGQFEGTAVGSDDMLIGTDTTDAQGRYEFEFLDEGRYFVEQASVPGRLQRPGANLAT